MFELRPFQRIFIKEALSAKVDTGVLSLPRGNGKSSLAGYLAARLLSPGDELFRAGTESVCIAATLQQGRIVFRVARDILGNDRDYRISDSLTMVQITHKPTKTVLQVRSSNAKGALGLLNCPLVIGDEPGAWGVGEGQAMFDAITTAQGKPGSPLKAIFIGTLAPAHGGWWHELVEGGSAGSTYVKLVQGDRDQWDQWPTIRKANPLTAISPEFRAKLLEERDQARGDSRLKARFMSYRLNIPSADESVLLLTVDDWKLVEARPVGLAAGRPIVGLDLGGGRAWSAAVAVWESGRMEAMAVAPGIPDLEAQERRDNVPSGTYAKLVDTGALSLAHGLRVQPPSALWEAIVERWGTPVKIVCDRFRLPDLRDAVGNGCNIEPRVTQWSSSSADIRALRKMSKDGPLSVDPGSRNLLRVSMSAALVENDNAGNSRLIKRSSDNKARDDVAAAATLAAGAFERASSAPVRKLSYASV